MIERTDGREEFIFVCSANDTGTKLRGTRESHHHEIQGTTQLINQPNQLDQFIQINQSKQATPLYQQMEIRPSVLNSLIFIFSNVIKLSFSGQKGYSYWKFVTQKCL